MSRLVIKNINTPDGRSSMRLEETFWDAARDICLRENIDLTELIVRADPKGAKGERTSRVRDYVLRYYRKAAKLPAVNVAEAA